MSHPSARASDQPGAPAFDMERLFQEHYEYLRRLVQDLLGPGHDPEDLTQEILILAWRKLHELRGGNPRTWLAEIAIKRASNWRRGVSFRRLLGLERAGDLADYRTPEREAQANEASRIVYAVLDRMSEKRRTVFILFELKGMSGHEIALALGCPIQTVYTRLHHARLDFEARIAKDPKAQQYEDWS